ncbi:substrate-binding domain-containing protein [Rugamonas sp. CCM 8940]|uniref:substrate-binding domain-containing protein n=1 Tax=Rugamonas sp. CCM 8940 TaxID=2765359 RepID=UPI0018F423B9|nr:substrate-binding domain-containing protein [Rugamonas sp. CCM 8940]MBJ7311150.1 substrate-binding domain-containing protein [Rugamonas sp. CCM 8940]
MRQLVERAGAHGAPWSGPQSGPPAQPGAAIAIVSEDLRNGGVLGVVQGVKEAAAAIGWSSKVYDAAGSAAGRADALAAALAARPAGLLLVGVDAGQAAPLLAPLARRGVPMVGWHVGPRAGPQADGALAMNVSSDPLDVARITAMAAVVQSAGRAGVVIFTDSNYTIASAKAAAMAEVIRACRQCRLLGVEDVALSHSAARMPAVTRALLARHGAAWSHALAINDLYFDYAAQELTKAGRSSASLRMLSAGDGSAAALQRIQAGIFQVGTAAEPLNLHGWQLVDELNRLLAHQPVSGYIVPVHLVTPDNIAFDGGARLRYDPDNGYRDIYRRIWKR